MKRLSGLTGLVAGMALAVSSTGDLHAKPEGEMSLYKPKAEEMLPDFGRLKPWMEKLVRGDNFNQNNSIVQRKYNHDSGTYETYTITCWFGSSKEDYLIYAQNKANEDLFRRFNILEKLMKMRYRANDNTWITFKCPEMS